LDGLNLDHTADFLDVTEPLKSYLADHLPGEAFTARA
jgi:hypothetical protein